MTPTLRSPFPFITSITILESVHFQLFWLGDSHLQSAHGGTLLSDSISYNPNRYLRKNSRNTFLGEELADVVALVALQLENLAVLRVFNNCAVACKVLFAGTNNLLLVEVFGDSLHSCQRFSAVSLLNPNVDQPVLDHDLQKKESVLWKIPRGPPAQLDD